MMSPYWGSHHGYVALFDNNTKLKITLLFDRIEYWSRKKDAEDLNKSKEKFNETKEPSNIDDYEIDNETTLFLTYYILYLNSYLETCNDQPTKKILTEKKYLLLSLSDLLDTSYYFLRVGTLDSIALPTIEESDLDDKSFNFLVNSFETIFNHINIKDSDINNNPNLKAFIIINILILKCYLDLSTNKVIKDELIAEITNPDIYKNPEYSILSDIIDDIIFKEKYLQKLRKRNEE